MLWRPPIVLSSMLRPAWPLVMLVSVVRFLPAFVAVPTPAVPSDELRLLVVVAVVVVGGFFLPAFAALPTSVAPSIEPRLVERHLPPFFVELSIAAVVVAAWLAMSLVVVSLVEPRH